MSAFGSKIHRFSVIQNILDYDYVDTENTDYIYLKEEEDNFGEGANVTNDLNESCNFELTFNEKALSMYETEYIAEPTTAAGSTQ